MRRALLALALLGGGFLLSPKQGQAQRERRR